MYSEPYPISGAGGGGGGGEGGGGGFRVELGLLFIQI